MSFVVFFDFGYYRESDCCVYILESQLASDWSRLTNLAICVKGMNLEGNQLTQAIKQQDGEEDWERQVASLEAQYRKLLMGNISCDPQEQDLGCGLQIYNASNNELVRTQTLVKSAIV